MVFRVNSPSLPPLYILVFPLAGKVSAAALIALYVSVQGGGEGGKSTKTESAGKRGQLSNNGIAEATRSLDLQGTLNNLDSDHLYRETLERRQLWKRPRARWVENSCISLGFLLVITL